MSQFENPKAVLEQAFLCVRRVHWWTVIAAPITSALKISPKHQENVSFICRRAEKKNHIYPPPLIKQHYSWYRLQLDCFTSIIEHKWCAVLNQSHYPDCAFLNKGDILRFIWQVQTKCACVLFKIKSGANAIRGKIMYKKDIKGWKILNKSLTKCYLSANTYSCTF